MLYLYCALVANVAVFSIGLTVSIIDINRYNFGLYLVLISVVASSLLAAIWVAKPKSCMGTPKWVLNLTNALRRGRRIDRQNPSEVEKLLQRYHAEQLLSNIRGIPHLIQAIQCSLEVSYASLAKSAGHHHCQKQQFRSRHRVFSMSDDSAIDSCDNMTVSGESNHRERSTFRSSRSYDKFYFASCKKQKTKGRCEFCRDDSEEEHNFNAQLALKRQSVFVIFPYSETSPIASVGKTTGMRRSSSAEGYQQQPKHDDHSKIGGSGAVLPSPPLDSSDRNQDQNFYDIKNDSCNEAQTKYNSKRLKRHGTGYRRPSFEVRLIGLQNLPRRKK